MNTQDAKAATDALQAAAQRAATERPAQATTDAPVAPAPVPAPVRLGKDRHKLHVPQWLRRRQERAAAAQARKDARAVQDTADQWSALNMAMATGNMDMLGLRKFHADQAARDAHRAAATRKRRARNKLAARSRAAQRRRGT